VIKDSVFGKEKSSARKLIASATSGAVIDAVNSLIKYKVKRFHSDNVKTAEKYVASKPFRATFSSATGSITENAINKEKIS
jgi:hypothetical protein